jgi:glycerophosphoryl diester phosphodiesterase
MLRGVALFLLAFCTWCANAAAQTSVPAQLDIQGHRGARGLMPENSMPAFKKALSLRVPTLELDLQLTQDHVFVVYHDAKLDPERCVYDDGRKVTKQAIAQLRYDALAHIDCGRVANPRFPKQQTVAATRIPRLQDVLALASGADYPVRLSVEIKWSKRSDGLTEAAYARQLLTSLKQYGLTQRTIVQSFHAPALLAVGSMDPTVRRAILVRQPDEYDAAVKQSRATILSPRYDGLRHQDVEHFQRAGIAVIPWTVNEAADLCRLIAWGVDGLITDYPDRAMWLVKNDNCRTGK